MNNRTRANNIELSPTKSSIIKLSIEENDRFIQATLCHICKRIYQPFIENDPNSRKVRNHDHITENL